jgi:hypothetical protein
MEKNYVNLKLWYITYLSIQVLRFALNYNQIFNRIQQKKQCRIGNKLIKSQSIHLGTIKKGNEVIIRKLPYAPLNPYHIISSFLRSKVLKQEVN